MPFRAVLDANVLYPFSLLSGRGNSPDRQLPACGGAAGSCTVTQRPPAARGVRVRVPSCAWVMLLTIARPRPTPEWSVRMRSVPRRNGSTSVATNRGVSFSPVFSTVSTTFLGLNAGRDPHGALFSQIVDDRVVHEIRTQLHQERVRADGGGRVTGRLDGDAAFFCEGEQRVSGFFRDERQVDVFSGEGPLVGAA